MDPARALSLPPHALAPRGDPARLPHMARRPARFARGRRGARPRGAPDARRLRRLPRAGPRRGRPRPRAPRRLLPGLGRPRLGRRPLRRSQGRAREEAPRPPASVPGTRGSSRPRRATPPTDRCCLEAPRELRVEGVPRLREGREGVASHEPRTTCSCSTRGIPVARKTKGECGVAWLMRMARASRSLQHLGLSLHRGPVAAAPSCEGGGPPAQRPRIPRSGTPCRTSPPPAGARAGRAAIGSPRASTGNAALKDSGTSSQCS
jgi:hypothetical protein